MGLTLPTGSEWLAVLPLVLCCALPLLLLLWGRNRDREPHEKR